MAGLEDFVPLEAPVAPQSGPSVGLDQFSPVSNSVPAKPDYRSVALGKPIPRPPVSEDGTPIPPEVIAAAQSGKPFVATQQPGEETATVAEVPTQQSQVAAPAAPAAPLQWDTVKNSPKYKAMPADQQESIRNKYFVDYIAPKVPTDQLEAIKGGFDADTKPTVFNKVKWAVGDLFASSAHDTLPENPKTAKVADTFAKLSPEKRDQIAATIDPLTATGAQKVFLDLYTTATEPLLAREALKNPQFFGPSRPGPTIQRALEQIASPESIKAAEKRLQAGAKATDKLPETVGTFEQVQNTAIGAFPKFGGGILDAAWGMAQSAERKLKDGEVPMVGRDPLFDLQYAMYKLFPKDKDERVKQLETAKDLNLLADRYQSELQKMSWDQAYNSGMAGAWMVAQTAAQSPQFAMTLATVAMPTLAPITLPLMGFSAGGNQYEENAKAGVPQALNATDSTINGMMEVITEGLGYLVGRAAAPVYKKFLESLSPAQKHAIASSLMARVAAATGTIGAGALVEGTGEAAGQVVQDLSQKNIAERDPGDMAANARTAFFASLLPGAGFSAGGIAADAYGNKVATDGAEQAKQAALKKWADFGASLRGEGKNSSTGAAPGAKTPETPRQSSTPENQNEPVDASTVLETPVVEPAYAGPDRRTDAATRKRLEDMTPDEMRAELEALRKSDVTDLLTGLPNRNAYEKAERLPVVATVDVDSFKTEINDTFGHKAGDQVLVAVADAFRAATAPMARTGGDEFTGDYNTPEEARKALDAAREHLGARKFYFDLPDGTQKVITGVGFSYGIGKDIAEADAALYADKAEREKAGLRRPRPSEFAQGNAGSAEGQQTGEGGVNEQTASGKTEQKPAAETAIEGVAGNEAAQGADATGNVPDTVRGAEPSPSGKNTTETPVTKSPSPEGDVHLGHFGVMPPKDKTPGNDHSLTLKKTKDGYTLMQGKSEAIDFDSGEPITYASVDEAVADLRAELKRESRRFLSGKQGVFFADEFKAKKGDGKKKDALADRKAMLEAKTEEGATEFKIGEMVKFQSPGVQGPIKRTGLVERFLPDGKIEVRGQDGGIYKFEPNEIQPVGAPPVAEQIAAVEKTQKVKKQFEKNTLFTADKVEAARARMRKKFGTLNSGIDPELLTDGLTLAGAYIEAGVRDFTAYAKAMVEDFGDGVKPYLLSFYEAARHYPGLDTKGMSSADEAATAHAKLITPEVEKQAEKAIGEKPKAKKRAAADPGQTIRQDWGVPHIDGWTEIEGGKNQGSDFGLRGGMKDAFLADAKKYLNGVADQLRALGFTEYLDKGKKAKSLPAVSANPSGPATSGDVSLTMRRGFHGVYVHIGATSMRGMGLSDHPQGIAIMARVTRNADKDRFATGGSNQWLSPATTIQELSQLLDDQTLAPEEDPAQDNTQEADNGTVAPSGIEPGDNQTSGSDGQPARADTRPLDGGVEEQDTGAGESGPAGGGSESPVRNGENDAGTGEGHGAFGQSREDGPVGDRPAATGVNVPPTEFNITDDENIGEGNLKQKYRDNIAAIKLVKELDAAGERATPEQQSVLAKYVGWGGIKGVFNPENKQWGEQHLELKALLDEDEFAAARRSMLDAHYTSTDVIDGIYAGLRHMGYNGGRALEPSIGVGNFIGRMPADMRRETAFVGVELDKITGQIVRHLYPTAKIATPKGFQEVNLPSNTFDIAVGNPPFGSQSVFDPNHANLSKFSLHNFFFAKSIDKLRPGGINAMVVSRYLLDSSDGLAREWMAKNARFLGAVRLPNTAFKGNANTEVVTDIIFLQKLDGEDVKANPQDWVGTTDQRIATDDQGQPVFATVNDWYIEHPEYILGTVSAAGSMYKANEYTVEGNTEDIAGAIERAVKAMLPKDIYQRGAAVDMDEAGKVDIAIPENLKHGNYFSDEKGGIYRQSMDVAGNPIAVVVEGVPASTADRIRGMIKIRDAVRNLMRAERMPETTEATLTKLRADLNKVYDNYIKKFGYLNSLGNRRAMADDPDMPLLESLEPDYDAGLKATSKAVKEKGETPRPPYAKKADIFTKRVLQPEMIVTTAATPKDALIASLNRFGRIDTEYMEQTYGKGWDSIAGELKGIVYNDPQAGWVTADEYLSGNVKAKLQVAKAQKNPAFEENIKALEEVQPVDLPPTKISVRLGSTWLPADVISDFTKHLTKATEAPVSYIPAVSRWYITASGANATAVSFEFGTPDLNAVELIDRIMNNREIAVKENIGTSKEPNWITKQAETEAALAKAEEIRNKFRDWIWADGARADRLAQYYNDHHNTNRDRTYDGSHLTLPGSSPAITLRRSQLDAIWRALSDRVVLLDHVVGAGKTFIMAGIAMELRRMGISKKPLLVVPNHLVRSWRDEIFRLYPSANVLVATEKDFEKNNRRRLFARIATGDWDAVVIGHSSVKKIGLPPESAKKIIEETLTELSDAIEEMKRARGDRNVIKDMERIKDGLKSKIAKINDKAGKKDDVVNFDELGVDAIMVDELHEFKNLFFYTQMQKVAGLGSPSGSGKAFDLFVKFRNLVDRFGERAVRIGATGTPVSNSLVEMFTMQRYMMYDEMKRQGIHLLDGWAGVYGDVQQVYEVHPSGSGYRMATRFAKFVNIQSLMRSYKSFADIITMDTLKKQSLEAGKVFPVPKVAGGKPKNIVAERSDLQEELFGIPEFIRLDDGSISFKLNEAPDQYEVARQDDGNWGYRLLDNQYFIKGGLDSEKAATQQLVMDLLTPVTTYNKDSILWMYDNLRELNRSTKGKINALSITNRARKAGLDYRLIDPSAPDFPGSKVNIAVKEIKGIYDKWNDDKGTQLVFCDLSVPAAAIAQAAAQERAVYVRSGDGLKRVKATSHNIPGLDAVFYIAKEGGGFVAYDAMTGARADGAQHKPDLLARLRSTADRAGQQWLDALRGSNGMLTDESIQEWRDENEEAADEGEGEDDTVSLSEVLALAGAGAKFSVYDDMKAKLIAAGIPANEIAFIHEANTSLQKNELFKKVKAGTVRILFGSTPKLGAGTNVQDRLVALHHMDAPWRPSDLEQREGRIIRQQNKLYDRDPEGFEVIINRYATRQTYDTRMWQIIEHKANGVEQLRKAGADVNELEDIGGEAASSADMKAAASGNPLILEEIKLRNQVKSLQAQRDGWTNGRLEIQRKLRRAEITLPAETRKVEQEYVALIKIRDDNTSKEEFSIVLGGEAYDDKKVLGKPFAAAFALAIKNMDVEVPVGKYRGFDLFMQARERGFSEKRIIVDVGYRHGKFKAYALEQDPSTDFSALGLITRLDNRMDSFETVIKDKQGELAYAQRDIPELNKELAKPFAKEGDLVTARKEHMAVVSKLKKAGADIAASPEMRKELDAALAVRKKLLEDAGLPTTFDDGEAAVSQEEYEKMIADWDAEGGQIYGLAGERDAAIDAATDEKIMRQWGSDGNPNVKFSAGTRAKPFYGNLPRNYQTDTKGDAERLRREASRSLGIDLPAGSIRLAALPDDSSLQKIAAAFGKRVVGFESTSPLLNDNGATFPGGDVIYINIDATRPHLAVLGHELGHQLKKEAPAVYLKLVNFIRDQINQGKYAEFGKSYKGYSVEDIREEFVGEVFSDGFMDPGFWYSLASHNQSLYHSVVNALQKLWAKVKEALKPYTPKTDKYFKDYAAVMRMAGEAMAEYQASKKGKPGPAKFSQSDRTDQTESPAFAKWFGDSKVVDENGKPLVVYHGTNVDFATFKTDIREDGVIFLSDNSEVADEFAVYRSVWPGANTMPVYAKIENPLVIEGNGRPIRNVEDEFTAPDAKYGETLRDYARRNGHDGLLFRDVSDAVGPRPIAPRSNIYAAFRPEQIKSAIGNNGQFDASNPDIRFNQADTEAFKKWFGDSKVVDANGKPLVVYHGTRGNFNSYGGVNYFTDDASYADIFAGGTQASNIMPVYLSLQNPIDATSLGHGALTLSQLRQFFESNGVQIPAEFDRRLVESYKPNNLPPFWELFSTSRGIVDSFSKAGFDGLILKENAGKHVATAYVNFRPEQIKSAIGNNGQFDASNPDIRFNQADTEEAPKESRRGLLDNVLRVGGGQLAAKYFTKPTINWLIDTGAKLVPEKVKAGMVSNYGLPADYIDKREAMEIGQMRGALKARSTAEIFSSLTREQSRVGYLWLNEKDEGVAASLMERLPEQDRKNLEAIEQQIDDWSQEALRLGLITPEAYERHKHAYVHRTYEKYEAEDPKKKGARARAIKFLGDQFKGRGMADYVADGSLQGRMVDGKPVEVKGQMYFRLELRSKPAEDGTTKLRKMVYWPASTPIPDEYKGWKQQGTWEARYFNKPGKVGLWRDFTADERQKMGEIDEIKYALAKTINLMTHDLEVARLFEWVANEYAEDSPEGLTVAKSSVSLGAAFKKDDWVHVPTVNIEGTSVPVYGSLSGKYVPGPIWNDIRQLTNSAKIWEWYRPILTAWKLSKTVFSIGTHMNNVMGNFIMADMHDVGFRDLIAAATVLRGKTPEAKAMLERYQLSGAELGSFVTKEIKQETMQELLRQLQAEVDRTGVSAAVKAADIVARVFRGDFSGAGAGVMDSKLGRLAVRTKEKMVRIYAMEDTFFRVAAFIKAVDDGYPDQVAGRKAREDFLDYNINAPWVNAARGTFLPFAAFTYRAVPKLVTVGRDKPWKLAKYMMMFGGLSALSYALLGLSGDDEDKERAFLPDEKKGKIWGVIPKLIRMPWNDKHNSPVFLDVRRWIPIGDIVDFGQNHAAVPIPPMLMPGGPLSIAIEVLANKSSFTGKDITNRKVDTEAEQLAKSAGYIYQNFMPNLVIVPGSYAQTAVSNANKGRTDKFGRDQSVPMALASSVGIKLGAYPTNLLKSNEAAGTQATMRALKAEGSNAQREFARGGISREEMKRQLDVLRAKEIKTVKEFQEKANPPKK